ncbi:hypothetical protein JHK84_036666 [Glycine max]|nr:hypothetical protein JHK85_036989 [Glycine max]KAG5130269.1 hypothetical protein JHK84_036666 [Glycine max]
MMGLEIQRIHPDGGKRVPEIEMSLLDTILDLKQKIQELDVEVYRQRLWHKDRMLRDNELIHDQAFCASKTLHLTVTPLSPQHTLSVKVKFVGSDGYVEVKETDKVRDLCSKVERQWGIPSELIPL